MRIPFENSKQGLFHMKNITNHFMIPMVIVLCWLIFIGESIWRHTIDSVQPPQSDPLTYMQKAMNFWKAVDQGELFNPLNIEPTNRPPGTILMSYPFGFSSDFKGFLFRSIFLPIVCIVLAVYMAAGLPGKWPENWIVAGLAILFSSIPMFYHFDCCQSNPGPTHWGLVDNFQAGIAAMAAAGFIRSLNTRSLKWLIAGLFFSSLTLMVKPSGLMIMALLALIWTIVVGMEWVWTKRNQRKDIGLYRYAATGGIIIILVYSCIVLLCITSKYFSKENFAYASQALKVMKVVLEVPSYVIVCLVIIYCGFAFILWGIINGFQFLKVAFRSNHWDKPIITAFGLLLGAIVIWISGGWYWLVVQSGGNQVRYFYPFFLMGAVCMIPMSIIVLQHTTRQFHTVELSLCFLSAFNIGLLLSMEMPSLQWQKLAGVNVTVDQDLEVVNQAYSFLEELRQRNESGIIYFFMSGMLSNIFMNVGVYEALIRPDIPVFQPTSMMDWTRGFVVRIDELLNASYILIRKDLESSPDQRLDRSIHHSASESDTFQMWLCELDQNSGVQTISDGRDLRVLEILNKKAFTVALDTFVSSRTWRTEFIEANARKLWTNALELAEESDNFLAKEIDFDGVYCLHGILLHRDTAGMKVEVWWEQLHQESINPPWNIFFHLVDRFGNISQPPIHPLILDNYDPPAEHKRWRYGSFSVDLPISTKNNVLAFGIFRPDHDFLMPDKGNRDWGGWRVLIPIPEIDS